MASLNAADAGKLPFGEKCIGGDHRPHRIRPQREEGRVLYERFDNELQVLLVERKLAQIHL